MDALLEHTSTILLVGGTVLVGLLAGWYQLRDSRLLGGALAVLVLLLGWGVMDRWIVTERERVEQVIDAVALAVLDRNPAQAVSHIHQSRPEIRERAQGELQLFQVTEISIKRPIKIEFSGLDRAGKPSRATAGFNVVVTGGDVAGLVRDSRVPRYLEVEFFKDGDRWWVDGYSHHDPLHELRTR